MNISQRIPACKHVIWNTRKKRGWERYKQRREANNIFLKPAEDKEADTEHISKKIEKELESIKYKVFGKVKIAEKNNKNARQFKKLATGKEYNIKK